MDESMVREHLKKMFRDIAEKARRDALNDTPDISDIYSDSSDRLLNMSDEELSEIISNIDKAASTKEGARRLVSAISLAAKAIVRIYLR